MSKVEEVKKAIDAVVQDGSSCSYTKADKLREILDYVTGLLEGLCRSGPPNLEDLDDTA